MRNGSRFIDEFVSAWNKLCEGRPWIPTMDMPEFPEDILEDMADKFEKLSKLPQVDPSNPQPLYVSRMHFEEWAADIRKVMSLLSSYGPIEEKDGEA